MIKKKNTTPAIKQATKKIQKSQKTLESKKDACDDIVSLRVRNAMEMHMEDAKNSGNLCYYPNIFTNCSFPHSRPKGPDGLELNDFSRKNGALRLAIQAGPSCLQFRGIPYGIIPRRVLAWISTQAKIKKSAKIDMAPSMTAFLGQLGMASSGGETGAMTASRNQCLRLLSCRIWTIPTLESFGLLDKAYLWWDPLKPDDKTRWASCLQLTRRGYAECSKHAIPFDRRGIDRDPTLRRSPLGFDLFVWLPYRCFRASLAGREARVPWRSIMLQFGAGYADNTKGINNFRIHAKPILAIICAYYPVICVDFASSSEELIINPTLR